MDLNLNDQNKAISTDAFQLGTYTIPKEKDMWIQVLWMFFLVDSMNYRIQKLFFFGFGNPKVTVHKAKGHST